MVMCHLLEFGHDNIASFRVEQKNVTSFRVRIWEYRTFKCLDIAFSEFGHGNVAFFRV